MTGVSVSPEAGMVERVWAGDSWLWGPGEDDPADRLGWLRLPEQMASAVPELEALASSVAAEGVSTVVLLGMGGSSLAPEVFAATFGSPGAGGLRVMDSTHPDAIGVTEGDLDLERCVFVVSSKSGSTVETMSLYRHFRTRVDEGSRYIAVTDPGTSLEKLADREEFRRSFLNPPDIGGRYSALSYFGLVPAALCGVDLRSLLAGAQAMATACGPQSSPESNTALQIGAAIGALAASGRDKLTFLISEPVAAFGMWVEQLIAESTGKQGLGITPVVDEPPSDPGGYGSDRAFVHLHVEGDDSLQGRADAVAAADHPLITVSMPDPAALGGEMWRWEFATAVAGAVLGINPFDQPNVEAAKRAAQEALESGAVVRWPEDDPAELFEGAAPPELACLLAFAPRSQATEAVMERGRRKLLREAAGIATSTGFGPRYLHSTGQLHKGGRKGVRALVVFAEPEADLPIPGSDHTFARLVAAQAAGDARALEASGRRVARTSWRRFESWATS